MFFKQPEELNEFEFAVAYVQHLALSYDGKRSLKSLTPSFVDGENSYCGCQTFYPFSRLGLQLRPDPGTSYVSGPR